MSTTSYVPVRFVGGPSAGTDRLFAGEPKRQWVPKAGAGTYRFEWDRGDDGVKLRSGVYTWDASTDTEPADGDAASAQGSSEPPAQDTPSKAPAKATTRKPSSSSK